MSSNFMEEMGQKMYHSLTLTFFVRQSRVTHNTECMIYARLQSKGQRVELSTGLKVKIDRWSKEQHKVKGNTNSAFFPQQAYSKIEKNPKQATLERLLQLSEVLGVKVNSIVGEDDMYIQQNFQQQGGNASTVMYVTGLADKERESLNQQIISLQKQLEVLTKIIESKL